MSLQESLTGRGKRRRAAKESALNKGTGLESKRALYHCNYCQKDISNVPRIKCAICLDFDLCLECFSVGVEITPHKSNHDYRVVDNLSFPIFHHEWGFKGHTANRYHAQQADEELLLLEAIDMYGLGNWAAVAEHVGGKTADLCKGHYYEIYVDVDTFPLPSPTPEMAQVDGRQLAAYARQQADMRKRQRQQALEQQPQASNGPVGSVAGGEDSTTLTGAGEAADLSTADMDVDMPVAPWKALAAGTVSEADAGEQADGVMKQEEGAGVGPGSEVDANGELHLSAMEREAAKGQKRERKTQQATVEEDNKQQQQHHETAGSRSLHQTLRVSVEDPTCATPRPEGAADEKPCPGPGASAAAPTAANGPLAETPAPTPTPGTDVKDKAKPLVAQGVDITGYHAKRNEFDPEYDNEAETVIADMEFTDYDTQQDRKHKLRTLEIYNRRLDEREKRRAFILEHGLLNMRKVQALEKKRTGPERDTHARLRVFARYQMPADHDELVEGLLLEQRLRARIQELKEYRRNGVRTLADAEIFDSERRRQRQAAGHADGPLTGAAAGQGAGGAGGAAAGMAGLASVGSGSVAAAAAAAAQAVKEVPKNPSSATAPGGSRNAGAALLSWRTKRGVALDISCLPGVELLSQKERELCATARLLPAHYLALKDMMMRDSAKHGAITRQEARTFFRLDSARCLRLYDLWVACGWVTAGKSTYGKASKAQAEAEAGQGSAEGGAGGQATEGGSGAQEAQEAQEEGFQDASEDADKTGEDAAEFVDALESPSSPAADAPMARSGVAGTGVTAVVVDAGLAAASQAVTEAEAEAAVRQQLGYQQFGYQQQEAGAEVPALSDEIRIEDFMNLDE